MQSGVAAPVADVGAIAVLWLAGQRVDETAVAAAVTTAATHIAATLA